MIETSLMPGFPCLFICQLPSGILPLVLILLSAAVFLILFIITGRKKRLTTRKLENTESLLSTFINAESDLVYLKDKNYKYIMVNKALAKFYKRSPEELIGRDDYDLSDKNGADRIRKADNIMLDKMAVTEELVTYAGRTSIITKFPVLLPSGKYGIGTHMRDITKEHKQELMQEKLLRRAEILITIAKNEFKSQDEQRKYVLQQALELTESKYGYIFIYNEDKKELTLSSWSEDVMSNCNIPDAPELYQLEKTGIWGEAVRQRKPIIINNFDAPNPLKRGYPEGHVKIRRFISVPVLIDGIIIAVAGMANKEEEYDDNDTLNLEMVMIGLWQAIQRKDSQEQLAYERNKYRQTLISIGDGVMVVDGGGYVEILNSVAQNLTGWSDTEAHGKYYKDVFCLSHENPDQSIEDPIAKVLATKAVHGLGNHAMLTSRNGFVYNLEDSAAPILNDSGSCVGVVLVFRDVTQKKEQRKRIEYLSYHDQLTGLYNRGFFEEELIRLDTERNLPISILMGDVNGLKITNDIFGHAYGDELLKTLAEVFRHECRSDDIIARWGGDEFVILLPKTQKKDAENIALRIKDGFAGRQVKAIKGSISIGIACKTAMNQDMSDVLDSAEELMYSIKTLERENITDEEIGALIDMFHQNSSKDKAHSTSVSEICGKLGKALGLSGMELRNLKEAGYMHDIGKIILPSDFPDAAQDLTENELSELKKHPVVGYRILNSSDMTVGIAEAILAHHERWDGSGYPKGLKGEEIPLLARIIAVAEYYDRLPQNEAKSFMKNNAGVIFDPYIVNAFLDILKDDGSII